MATTVSTDDIQGLYIAYFNRPADYRGLLFWQQAANNAGGDINAVANAFAASPEYTKAFAGLTNLQIVDQIYVNLFGRHAELDGLNFWADALDNKVLGVGNIAYQIMKGAHDTPGGFQDATAVASKVAAASAFYDALDTSAEVIAYSGDVANGLVKTWLSGVVDTATLGTATSQAGLDAITGAVVSANQPPVPTQTLTAGADTIVQAGTINGTDATFNAGDKITVTGTANILNIADTHGASAAGVPSGVSVSGVQTFNLTASGNIGAAGQNGAVAQVTTVTIGSSTAGAHQVNTYTITDASVTAGGTVAFTFNGQNGTYTSVTGDAEATAAAFANAVNLLAGTLIATPVTAIPGTSTTSTVVITAPVAGVALPGLVFGTNGGTGTLPTVALTTPGQATHTVNFSYAGVSSSYVETGVPATDASNLANAINAIAGGTVAVANGVQVVLTAPVAGTPLPTLAFTAGAGSSIVDVPGVVLTTANGVGSGSATPVVYDVSGFTGLTNFVTNSTGAGGDNLKAATTTNVTATAAGGVAIEGGNAVTVKAAGVVSSAKAAGDVSITTSGNVTVTEAGGAVTVATKGNISGGGGTSFTATITDAVSNATRIVHTRALTTANNAASDALDARSDASTLVSNLNTLVTGYNTVALTVTVAQNNAVTLTALNNGYITQAQKTAIDTAFATARAATGATDASLKAAVLAALAPITAAAAAAYAAADAAYTTAQVAANAAQTVVTNDGTGVQAISNTVNTKLATATINGNWGGTTTINDGTPLKTSLTSVSLTNAGTANLTGNALTTVSITDSSKSVFITNNTIGHTQNLNLSAVTAGTITDNNATTVNIKSAGTANSINLAASLATTVNISGATNFTDTAAASSLAINAAINASTATGNIKLNIGNGQSFTGGSGSDTITTTAGGPQTGAVNAGTGTADRLVLSDVQNVSTNAAYALFTGFDILENKAAGSIDLSKFTNSTFGSLVLNSANNAQTVTGISAAVAANITVKADNETIDLTVTGATQVGQLDVVHLTVDSGVGGGANIDLNSPTIAGVETLQVTAVDNVTIDALTGMTALTSVKADGAGDFHLTTDNLTLNVNTVIDAKAVTGTVYVDASNALGLNGLQIIGSATGDSTLYSNGHSSVLSAGDGNNDLESGAGNDVITSGNGNSFIDAGNGTNTITVGNGFNTIFGGSGADTIKVGTGGNTITGNGGLDVITLGAHTIGTVDTLALNSANLGVANVATVNGFVTGTDVFQLDALTFASAPVGQTSITFNTGVTPAAAATLLSAVSVSTSVASLAKVYTQLASALDNSTGHEFAASIASTIVAREVVLTTGDAAGTYLVINDGNVGFQAGQDLVIKLVGNTTVVAGDIHVG